MASRESGMGREGPRKSGRGRKGPQSKGGVGWVDWKSLRGREGPWKFLRGREDSGGPSKVWNGLEGVGRVPRKSVMGREAPRSAVGVGRGLEGPPLFREGSRIPLKV